MSLLSTLLGVSGTGTGGLRMKLTGYVPGTVTPSVGTGEDGSYVDVTLGTPMVVATDLVIYQPAMPRTNNVDIVFPTARLTTATNLRISYRASSPVAIGNAQFAGRYYILGP